MGNKRKIKLLIIILTITLSLLVENGNEKVSLQINQPTPQITQALSINEAGRKTRVKATVVKVRDGDTIEVDLGDGITKAVRYIGIDTPETVDPRKIVQCFGQDASKKNKELVEGKVVELEKDVSETDKYARLLRYVYVDGIFVNGYLVEEGYAHASAYPPDIKYQEDLQSYQEEARVQNKGLWGTCTR